MSLRSSAYVAGNIRNPALPVMTNFRYYLRHIQASSQLKLTLSKIFAPLPLWSWRHLYVTLNHNFLRSFLKWPRRNLRMSLYQNLWRNTTFDFTNLNVTSFKTYPYQTLTVLDVLIRLNLTHNSKLRKITLIIVVGKSPLRNDP